MERLKAALERDELFRTWVGCEGEKFGFGWGEGGSGETGLLKVEVLLTTRVRGEVGATLYSVGSSRGAETCPAKTSQYRKRSVGKGSKISTHLAFHEPGPHQILAP